MYVDFGLGLQILPFDMPAGASHCDKPRLNIFIPRKMKSSGSRIDLAHSGGDQPADKPGHNRSPESKSQSQNGRHATEAGEQHVRSQTSVQADADTSNQCIFEQTDTVCTWNRDQLRLLYKTLADQLEQAANSLLRSSMNSRMDSGTAVLLKCATNSKHAQHGQSAADHAQVSFTSHQKQISSSASSPSKSSPGKQRCSNQGDSHTFVWEEQEADIKSRAQDLDVVMRDTATSAAAASYTSDSNSSSSAQSAAPSSPSNSSAPSSDSVMSISPQGNSSPVAVAGPQGMYGLPKHSISNLESAIVTASVSPQQHASLVMHDNSRCAALSKRKSMLPLSSVARADALAGASEGKLNGKLNSTGFAMRGRADLLYSIVSSLKGAGHLYTGAADTGQHTGESPPLPQGTGKALPLPISHQSGRPLTKASLPQGTGGLPVPISHQSRTPLTKASLLRGTEQLPVPTHPRYITDPQLHANAPKGSQAGLLKGTAGGLDLARGVALLLLPITGYLQRKHLGADGERCAMLMQVMTQLCRHMLVVHDIIDSTAYFHTMHMRF